MVLIGYRLCLVILAARLQALDEPNAPSWGGGRQQDRVAYSRSPYGAVWRTEKLSLAASPSRNALEQWYLRVSCEAWKAAQNVVKTLVWTLMLVASTVGHYSR